MTPSIHRWTTAVLLVGTGGSRLRAAIEVAEAGASVLAVGKRLPSDAHTTLAAGGINAALVTVYADESWLQHWRPSQDTEPRHADQQA